MITSTGVAPNRRKVFVVHGRNDQTKRSMFALLRSIGLDPVEWSEAVALANNGPSPFVGQILEAGFRIAQAVVVLLTGDDYARVGR